MISVYLMRSLQYFKLSLPSTGVNLLLFFLIIFNLNLFKKLIQKYYHTLNWQDIGLHHPNVVRSRSSVYLYGTIVFWQVS